MIAISEISEGSYSVEAEIIEVTSSELAIGDGANTIPVQIIVESIDGRWCITELDMGGRGANVDRAEIIVRA